MERAKTFIDAIEEAFKKYAGKIALIYLGRKISYAELKELVERFATGLASLGIKENDKVMIYLPNTPQWVIAYLAVIKMGAVAVPISPIYTPVEVAYMSNDCGAKTIICQDTNFGYVRDVMEKGSSKTIIFTNIGDMLPWWKRFVGFLFDKVPHGTIEKGEGIWNFMDILKHPPKPPQVKIKRPEEHLAFILYTGGTTGFPKGVPWTHAGLYYSGLFEWLEVLKGSVIEEGNSRLILQLPLFHILGLDILLAFGLIEGNTSILIPLPQVDAILECIQRYKAKLFFGVPTLYRMILENDRLGQYDLSSFTYCWSGGDVLPTEVFQRWQKKFNIPIHQIYGSTETNTLTTTDIKKIPELKSVGFPITSASKKFKMVDPDTLKPVEPGTPGELLVTAPWLLKTYLNKPEETSESFVELEGEIYYRTKDVLELKNGELYYVDRSADVIKYKGYRVSASEIETVLQDHLAVIGACVVGVPDIKVGERIKAFVVLKKDVRGVGSHDLIKWCRERLSSYKVPQYIEFRDMLPKSKVGKLLRREIRDEERRKIGKKSRELENDSETKDLKSPPTEER